MVISNNNKSPIRPGKSNIVYGSGISATYQDRYCSHCHTKLIQNPYDLPSDKYVYKCPTCGVTLNIHDTEPQERLKTAFPTRDYTKSHLAKHITQPDKQRMTRANQFISDNMKKRSAQEDEDPYLRILKQNNKIHITNIDYYDPTDRD